MKLYSFKRFITLSFFCFFFSLLLFNCEKEDDIFVNEAQTVNTKDYIAPHIVYSKDIKNNSKLFATLQHLKALNCKPKTEVKDNISGKLVFNEALNITIDDESAMFLESIDGSYHSYTFQAIDHEHPYGVQNIVLSLMPDGTYRELLVRYEVEGEEEIAFRNGETIDLTNKVSYAVLENGSFSSMVLSKVTTIFDCITIGETNGATCTGNQQHTWSERGSCQWLGTPNGPTPPSFYINIDNACIDTFETSGDGNNGEGFENFDHDWEPTDSVTTVPYVSPAEIARRATFRYEELGAELKEWFDNQSQDYRNSIYDFLEAELEANNTTPTIESVFSYTERASTEAKMTVIRDYVNDSSDPKWDTSYTGNYSNNSALEHNAKYVLQPSGNDEGGTMFRLSKNGVTKGGVFFVSNGTRVINPVNALPLASSELNLDGDDLYYYVHNPKDNRWYEYGLPVDTTPQPECLSCALNSYFQSALLIGGRYFIPLEDVLILFTGENFEGVESSRAVAGGFLLVEIIPGAKLVKCLKAIKYVDEAIQVAEVIVKVADNIFKKQKKIITKVLSGAPEYALDLYNNTKRKGNFGEILTDVKFYEKGYEPLHIRIQDLDETITQGIDAIYKNPNTGEFIIVESKFTSTGNAALSTLSNGVKQMSDEWILGNDRLINAVGAETAQEMLTQGWTSVLSVITPSGDVVLKQLDEAADIIGTWGF